jgi:hypothetical protein
MLRRISIGLIVALGAMGVGIPIPAIGSDSPPAGRIHINAPEPALSELTPPPLPSSAVPKAGASFMGVAASNHVSKLPADAVRRLNHQGVKVLTNREGELQLQAQVNGEERTLAIVDAVLPSGREVVGFGTVWAPPKPEPLAFIRSVSANQVNFAICSYAYMNSPWDDLHVHLCPIDAAYTLGILLVASAAIGGLVGVWIGGPPGAVAGIAIGTILALLAIIYWWTHSDMTGNVDFAIPNWTLQPPYGGYIYWYSPGVWEWMSDECHITDRGYEYTPYC